MEHTVAGRRGLSSVGTVMAAGEVLGKDLEGQALPLDAQLSNHTLNRSRTPVGRTSFMRNTVCLGTMVWYPW